MHTSYRSSKIRDIDAGGSAKLARSRVWAFSKADSPGARYCVPNEIICSSIARFLGLPVPPGGVTRMENEETPYYTSFDFDPDHDLERTRVVKSIDPDECLNIDPVVCAGIFVFDVFVANNDRKPQNLYRNTRDMVRPILLFDHGHALFADGGGGKRSGATQLTEQWDKLGVGTNHCFYKRFLNNAHFGRWVCRVSQIPDFFIHDSIAAARGSAMTEADEIAAVEFLIHRKRRLSTILNLHSEEIVIDSSDWTNL